MDISVVGELVMKFILVTYFYLTPVFFLVQLVIWVKAKQKIDFVCIMDMAFFSLPMMNICLIGSLLEAYKDYRYVKEHGAWPKRQYPED